MVKKPENEVVKKAENEAVKKAENEAVKKAENEAGAAPVEPLLTVEELAKRYSVPRWTIAGLMAASGWGEGKQLTEKEFTKALKNWLSGPTLRGGK